MRASSIRAEIKINDSVIVHLRRRGRKENGGGWSYTMLGENCRSKLLLLLFLLLLLLLLSFKKNFPSWNDRETDGVSYDEITRMLIKWNFCRLKLQFSLRVVLAKRDKTASSCSLAENQFRSSIRRFVNRFPFFFFFFFFNAFYPSSPLPWIHEKSKRRRKAFHTIRWLKVHICTGANINANKFDADGRLFTHPDIDIDAFDKFDRFNYCQTSPNWARLRIYVFN